MKIFDLNMRLIIILYKKIDLYFFYNNYKTKKETIYGIKW